MLRKRNCQAGAYRRISPVELLSRSAGFVGITSVAVNSIAPDISRSIASTEGLSSLQPIYNERRGNVSAVQRRVIVTGSIFGSV